MFDHSERSAANCLLFCRFITDTITGKFDSVFYNFSSNNKAVSYDNRNISIGGKGKRTGRRTGITEQGRREIK